MSRRLLSRMPQSAARTHLRNRELPVFAGGLSNVELTACDLLNLRSSQLERSASGLGQRRVDLALTDRPLRRLPFERGRLFAPMKGSPRVTHGVRRQRQFSQAVLSDWLRPLASS